MRRKGAAVLDRRHLVLFAEMSPAELQQALPLSYHAQAGAFLVAVFIDGVDFPVQTTESQLRDALRAMCPLNQSPLRAQYARFARQQLRAL